MAKVRHILTHGPNYQGARYEYGLTPPKDARIECTWHLLSLVDAIVWGCTTCCVLACDVLTDTGTARKECHRCVTYSCVVPTTKVPGMSTAQPHQWIPYLNVPGAWCLSSSYCVWVYDVLCCCVHYAD